MDEFFIISQSKSEYPAGIDVFGQNITVEILIKIFISLMHKYWYPYS